jgi:membrane glycosyltransferase
MGLSMDDVTASAGFRALPDEAPLVMPVQSLWTKPTRAARPLSSPKLIGARRLLIIGGAIVLTAIGAWQTKLVLAANGLTPLAVVMLLLFVALFAWIALSFVSAIAGFVSLLAGGGRRLIDLDAPPPGARTALLMPCYNENPTRVMCGLRAIWDSLCEAGVGDAFDIFILSDTTDPDIWIAEEAALLALRRSIGSRQVFYRRRKKNTARKAGNIADWVTRWGGAYEHFLILDADSLMQGETLRHLASAMEAHPDVGIIQTLPIITGGTTLLARLQQFAGRVYGPMIAHGIAWWHGAEGNYWGHNAIIRTRAFAERSGLPDLPGEKPFGGHILSHDFVEAALIRRGGWAVQMVPALIGSYEESPSDLVDLAVRDRRWCQGNLQHAMVLPARGLHWVSRLHLLTGIGSYITAPLWLLFMLTGVLIALRDRIVQPDYFPAGKTLFPVWPVVDPVRAKWMFVATMALLLIPKLLGCIATFARHAGWRGIGGGARLCGGVLLETLWSGLIAPVVMLTQCADVVSILLGRDAGWSPQRREGEPPRLRDVARRYRAHTIAGIIMAGVVWLISPPLAAWMSPVVLGLGLAIPIVAFTGRDILPGRGLLRIPEEIQPPPVMLRAVALTREAEPRDDTPPVFERLMRDPELLAAHRAMLPPARRPWFEPLEVPLLTGRARLEEAPNLALAWAHMTREERAACLADEHALDIMARRAREIVPVREAAWSAT